MIVITQRNIRLGVAAICGVVATCALLVIMASLIASGGHPAQQDKLEKIADIWQTDRSITDQLKELLPEKPEYPLEPPPETPQDLEMQIDAPASSINMARPDMGDLSIGIGGGFNRDSDYIPIYVPQPDYPPLALRRSISGYAVVEVIITTTGSVRDPKLVEEFPENKGFGKYALRAAKKLKYKPRVVDGVAEEVPGVLYKFSFQISK